MRHADDFESGAAIGISGGDYLECLAFMLQNEVYAVDIQNIKEIIEYGSLTTVPMMPNFIRGVINLRGGIVPVVDVRVRFEGVRSEITKRTCIVIVEMTTDGFEHLTVGLIVDAVNEVLEIPAAEIEPLPVIGTDRRADFINGMGKVDGRFVIILDVGKILSMEERLLLSRDDRMTVTDVA